MFKTYHYDENGVYVGAFLVEKAGEATCGVGYVLDPPADEEGFNKYQIIDGKWVEYTEITNQLKRNELSSSIHDRLTYFARTRNYNSIETVCSYANSTVEKFAKEAAYCIAMRDQSWLSFYEVMADVEAGKISMPKSIDDFMDRLPVLVWPN